MKPIVLAVLSAVLVASAPALAGDLKATLKNGSLIVSGGNGAEILTVSVPDAGPATIQIAPGAGTTVNGQGNPQPFTPVTLDVRIDLGAGQDQLAIGGAFPRDVRIDLGPGGDTLGMDTATVERNCSVDFGDLWEASFIDNSTVNGDLSLRFGEQGQGFAAFDLSVTHVVGRTSFTSGPSDASRTLYQCMFDGPVSLRQSGNATRLLLWESHVNGPLSVRAFGDASITVKDSTLNGDIRAQVSGGTRTTLEVLGTGIDGDVVLRSSSGTVNCSITDFTATGGARIDARGSRGSTCLFGNALFEENVSIRTDDGDDLCGFSLSKLYRDFTASTGGGEDLVSMLDTECRNVSMRTSAGSDDCVIGAASHVASFRAVTGDDADFVGLNDSTVDGDVVMPLASGSNIVEAKMSAIGGNLRITAGSDHDEVDLTGTTVTGTKKVKTGGGLDTLIE